MKTVPVIDLEASSLNETKSYPIEVGIYIKEYGQVINEGWLIKPVNKWLEEYEWSEDSAKIHNIPQQKLIDKGIDGYLICNKLNQLLSGMTIYSDAPDYDQMWLSVLFKEWNIEQLFQLDYILDYEYKKNKDKLFNLKFETWNKAKEEVIKENNLQLHRAKDDCLMLNKAFEKIIK